MLSGDNFSSLANEDETRRDENRIDGARRRRRTHLVDDVLTRDREARFSGFLVDDSPERDRRIGGEHFHHQFLCLRRREKMSSVSKTRRARLHRE